MAQVDFYILPDTAIEQRALFACRLVEKIYKLGHRVYVHTQDRSHAQVFDELLWRFQAASFVPHVLRNDDKQSSVQIGCSDDVDNDEASAVLINLSSSVPNFFNRFQRVSEVVVQDPDILSATRNAWRHYQQQGCTLERHDLRA